MKQVIIYDKNGISYAATLVDGIPEITGGFVPKFPFLVKIKNAINDIVWVLNSQYHRTNGPAREFNNGAKEWWVNDALHWLDGPAIEYADGDRSRYVNGQYVIESSYPKLVQEFLINE